MANTPQGTTPTHMEDVAQFLRYSTNCNNIKVVGNTLTVTPPGIHYIGCINPGVLPKWYVTLDTTEPYGSSTAQRAGLLRSTNEGTYNVSLITWRQHARMAGLWLRTHVPYATCYNTEQLLAIADETCSVPSPQHVDRTPPARKLLPKPVLKQLTLPQWAFKLGANSSQGTDPHEVIKVIRWPQYLSAACGGRGYTYSVWYYYFQLGMRVQGRLTLEEAREISGLYRKAEDAALNSLNASMYLPDYVAPAQARCRAVVGTAL